MIDLKHKKLYRSPRQGLIFGIAAGMANYFEVDAVFVRLAWIFLALITHIFPTIILYVVLFFLIPVDPAQDTVPQSQMPKDVTPVAPEVSEKMDSDQNV